MKKVLILTAGYGEGHNTAARNICEAIEAVAPGETQVRVLDLLETTYGRVNDLVKKAYLAAINHLPMVWEKIYGMIDSSSAFQDHLGLLGPLRHALEQLLEEEKPYAVVSTYPVYNYLIDRIYGEPQREQEAESKGEGEEIAPSPRRFRPFSQITVITDSITVNSIWYRCGSDAFIVANEETAAVLRGLNIPAEKLHVLGFPVSLRFAGGIQTRKLPGPGERWKVLYVVNSGKREAPETVRRLLALDSIDLQVTVGKDEELRAAVESVIAKSGRGAELYGWTNRMPELMAAAHLLISKAGGATVQESLAACTPMVITQVVPGQEEGNARLLLENDCGALAESPPEIAAVVEKAFVNQGTLWREWHANAKCLSRPGAARAIADFVLATPTPALPSGTL